MEFVTNINPLEKLAYIIAVDMRVDATGCNKSERQTALRQRWHITTGSFQCKLSKIITTHSRVINVVGKMSSQSRKSK